MQAMITYSILCAPPPGRWSLISDLLRNFPADCIISLESRSSAKYTGLPPEREVVARRAGALAATNDTQAVAEYIHRVRKSTLVPHFLYCITAMCRFARTLFRRACASGPSRCRSIRSASIVPVSKLEFFLPHQIIPRRLRNRVFRFNQILQRFLRYTGSLFRSPRL